MELNVSGVVEMLNELSDLETKLAEIDKELKEKESALMSAELMEAIAAIYNEAAEMVEPINTEVNELREAVKAVVIELGQTVKGAGLMATYTGPKPEVDMNKLMGYAAAHPDLNALITMKKPVVTIRRVK
jgi:cell division septum initiation protein DivIVA